MFGARKTDSPAWWENFLTEVQAAGGVDHAAPALGLSVQGGFSVNLYVAVFPSPAKKRGGRIKGGKRNKLFFFKFRFACEAFQTELL